MSQTLPAGTVTFLFTDIQGSTPLWEREPEKMAEALQIHNTALRKAIEAHGGVVFKTVGDAFQAAFATAPQALKAAIEGQYALQSAAWNELRELKVRMALHTGEAELDPGGDEYTVSHTKNRTARIMSAAHGGQVLLSAETFELVNHQLPPEANLRDMGEVHLKGLLRPEHLYQAVVIGLPAGFPPLVSEARPSHNLPLELTPFIGRQREIANVQEMLKTHRLVTLTGSGGVGKTRLSIQAAGQMLAEFPDGIWYVELAPISDPELVPHTAAATLGLRQETNRPILDTLTAFLSKRDLLLVLDNCEHLLEACAQMADILLRKAPKLRILTSSREALGIAGEAAFRVPSMAAPDPRQMPALDVVQEYEAVQLFSERARGALPTFAVTEHNAPAIAQICLRLDGIPLALELAAARLSLLTPEQLASRLDHAFRLLTGGSRTALPRQQTLRAAIDWSYRLLSPPEQSLLRRMAVFAGGSTLEAVETVCAGEGVEAELILDLLSGLVNKSMVSAERIQQEETRYRLLETVRQYAREKLYDSGESEALRSQHLDYFVALCEEAYPHIHGRGRIEWTRRLKRENDNIREALEWAFQDAALAQKGLRIATTLIYRYWSSNGMEEEAARWLNAGLQAAGETVPALAAAKALAGLASSLPDVFSRKKHFEQCMTLCREIGPEADGVLCLLFAHNWELKDYPEALVQTEEAVRIARTLKPAGVWELCEALFFYALMLYCDPNGAYDEQALAAAEESIKVAQTGDRWNVGGYWILGQIHSLRGQDELARRSFEMAMDLFSEIEEIVGLWGSSFWLALNHRLAGRYNLAYDYCRELFKAADAASNKFYYTSFVYSTGMLIVSSLDDQRSGLNIEAGMGAIKLLAAAREYLDGQIIWYRRFIPMDQRQIEELRGKLGDEAFSKAWKEGEALSLEQAVAQAREVSDA